MRSYIGKLVGLEETSGKAGETPERRGNCKPHIL